MASRQDRTRDAILAVLAAIFVVLCVSLGGSDEPSCEPPRFEATLRVDVFADDGELLGGGVRMCFDPIEELSDGS